MMLRALSLLCLVALAHSFPSQSDEDKKREEIFSVIFGPEPSTKSSDAKVPAQEKVPEKKEDEKCTIADKQGLCVPYYLCDTARDVISEGAGLIDIHFDDSVHSCLSYIDVCCEQKNISKDNPKETAKPTSA